MNDWKKYRQAEGMTKIKADRRNDKKKKRKVDRHSEGMTKRKRERWTDRQKE